MHLSSTTHSEDYMPRIFQIQNIALKVKAASASETSVSFYRTIKRNYPEDSHLRTRWPGNLKFPKFVYRNTFYISVSVSFKVQVILEDEKCSLCYCTACTGALQSRAAAALHCSHAYAARLTVSKAWWRGNFTATFCTSNKNTARQLCRYVISDIARCDRKYKFLCVQSDPPFSFSLGTLEMSTFLAFFCIRS
jgi:hypothetical protein